MNIFTSTLAMTIEDVRSSKGNTSGTIVFSDKDGEFIAIKEEIKWGVIVTEEKYWKQYVSGPFKGRYTGLWSVEYRALKDDYEKRFGYFDWAGDFVPGTERKSLPVGPVDSHGRPLLD